MSDIEAREVEVRLKIGFDQEIPDDRLEEVMSSVAGATLRELNDGLGITPQGGEVMPRWFEVTCPMVEAPIRYDSGSLEVRIPRHRRIDPAQDSPCIMRR